MTDTLSKRQELETDDQIALRRPMASVRIHSLDQRPTICFLCVGNPALPLEERIKVYKTPGLVSRHFQRWHINRPLEMSQEIRCDVREETLEVQMHLLRHAESAHGIASRGCAASHGISNLWEHISSSCLRPAGYVLLSC